jgi:hypothetical protein
MATISEPPNAHNGRVEYESADDFVLTTETVITHATFTGLLTGGATPDDVKSVDIEIYRVFPLDSDPDRIPQVPTRVNSPSDEALTTRDSAAGELTFHTEVVQRRFTVQASVSSADALDVNSGGDGAVTGREVEFRVSLRSDPLDLPPDHYFFVPQVGLRHRALADAHFLWLSVPRPIVPPGTQFPPGFTDLQSWMRDDPPLAPDWLRIGTDIIGGNPAPTFNAAFSLSGHTVDSPGGAPAPGLTPLASALDFTNQGAVQFNGLPSATAFDTAGAPVETTPAVLQLSNPREVTNSRESAPPRALDTVEGGLDDQGIAAAPLVWSTGI